MSKLKLIDPQANVFDVYANWQIKPRAQTPGPPQRIDGMTVGIVTMHESAPHGGEMHPDGDELLYVIAGKVEVHMESSPATPTTLSGGEGCIVPAGEWHRVEVLEPTQLLHMTPGPNGDHRPL